MKNLTCGIIMSVLLLGSISASAQNKIPLHEPDYNQPKLFADVASKFSVDVNALETLLDLPVGQSVNFPLTKGFVIAGTVVSKSDPSDPSVKSVVLSSTNRHGATMTFTKTRSEDNHYHYIGRILSYRNSDAFDLVQENGSYFLQKKQLYDMLSE